MVKKAQHAIPNHLLCTARKERGWTQQYVADRIGAPLALNVTRWERGITVPSAYYVERLCRLFDKSVSELGLLQSPQKASFTISTSASDISSELSRPWNVPFSRNPFFTGRSDLLTTLHEQLNKGQQAAFVQFQALTGLGGIGKTQIAIEYAYRYRGEYYAVFWVRAASHDTLVADFVEMAHLLQLPERDAPEHPGVVNAAKCWLSQHTNWLLILDNADDLALVADFLPTGGAGHLLLTTRTQATGKIASSIPVEKMEQREGVLLLLHRAKLLAANAPFDTISRATHTQAQVIAQALDGLPLALDQAGAYIEETSCSLAEYLDLFRTYQSALLSQPGDIVPYPYTVTNAWSLSLQKVAQVNPAAADLLRLCAFLDPDTIPEAILTDGASVLGPALGAIATNALRFNEAIQVLRGFSLIKRDAEARLLNIHRLVQAVLREGMDAQTQQMWAERAVRAVNATFPEVDFPNWGHCQQCLPHAQLCAKLINQYDFTFPEAARLLHYAGSYLYERGLYGQGEPLLQQAMALRERILGLEHPDTALTLNHLANLYREASQYEQAEPLYQRALMIYEKALGPESPNLSTALYELAYLYYRQGQYELAAACVERAMTIRQKVFGLDFVNERPVLHQTQRLYGQAEQLFRRAETVAQRAFEYDQPFIAMTLSYLAIAYREEGYYKQAEFLLQGVLAIREQMLGPNHPDTATDIKLLAQLYHLQALYEQAEPLYQRALVIYEQTLGTEHPDTATCLTNLARLYDDQGKYEQAEPLYQRAGAIREKKLGPEHPDTIAVLKRYTELVRKIQYPPVSM